MGEKPIYVTKAFLPPLEEYQKYLEQIWDNGQLTNSGPLHEQFEKEVAEYLRLGTPLKFVANGTLALQVALRALDITEGEIITTPFSYVATTSSILWEHCTPVFVDIDESTLNIDPNGIEMAITEKTKAILAVHVFGNPCDVEAIQAVADKHGLKVIYDAAHAFGVRYKDESILEYGDVSTLSFHATKLFHTIEGGAVIARDKTVADKVDLIRRFGHQGDNHKMLGINAKASEFQAAMGLLNLQYVEGLIGRRKVVSEQYDLRLAGLVERPVVSPSATYNFAYHPIILRDTQELQNVIKALNDRNVFPRRYFYPSLNKLPYIEQGVPQPISESIASRILCLPLYDSLDGDTVNKISDVVESCVKK
jgi:dTDP-4-amino-4,6-dideoxygalactose transaminase